MDKFIQKLQEIAEAAEKELEDNVEWVKRYADYASVINENIASILKIRKLFREPTPLYVYSNISSAKGAKKEELVTFDLRYKGQSVANIKNRKNNLKLVTKKNTMDFYGIEGGKTLDWKSKEAENFRGSFVKKSPLRNDNAGKGNEEHRYESALLTELSKTDGKNKVLKNIQPVDLVKSRFQMPTPFRASKINFTYARHKGGGIDLLCRTKHGGKSKLNIFELKDEYEDPVNVLRQAVIYSVFIHKLLKTPEAGSEIWLKLFKFSKAPVQINAVAALPKDKNNDKSFRDKKIILKDGTIHLHYFYFSLSKTDKIESSIETSIFN